MTLKQLLKSTILVFLVTTLFSYDLLAQAPENCIQNDLEVSRDLIISGSQGKFVFTPAFASGQDFMVIAPNDSNASGYSWDFGKALSFEATGELIKNVDSGTQRALSVQLSGTRNFQVMGNGTVYGRELYLQLSAFPDYVFAKDYTLLSLKEVEKHIQEKGHLPNIPSGKTIDEEGIGVGDLQILQMEKIEELTLYLIEMNKRLEGLEIENEQLKTEIRNLKK